MTSLAVWRAPFASGSLAVRPFGERETLADIVEGFGLAEDVAARVRVFVGAEPVDRAHWRHVRPRAGQTVTLTAPLAGGGGGGSRDAKAAASVAIAFASLLTAGAASAGFFAVGGFFAAQSTSATVLAASIGVAGTLAANAIAPPPLARRDRRSRGDDSLGAAGIGVNDIEPGGVIARVLGTRRLAPPPVVRPLVVRDGINETAEAVFALSGPHELADIRIGDVAIGEAEDVEVETRQGLPDDIPIQLVQRYSITAEPGLELSRHLVQADQQRRLQDQDNPERCLPKWHRVSAGINGNGRAPDEIWLHLTLPQGLYDSGSGGQQAIPLRIRMRRRGDTAWRNLPELHYSSNDRKELRPWVRIVWAAAPSPIPVVQAADGWVFASKLVPGQADPTTAGWSADAWFSAGAGNDGLYTGVEGTTNVRNVILGGDVATIHLAEPGWARDRIWEIEVRRGTAFVASALVDAAYTYSGAVVDFFHWQWLAGLKQIARTQADLADITALVRVASVWNVHPVAGGATGPGYALIAVRATNRTIPNLTVQASGLIPTWDGTGWTGLSASRNPADQAVAIIRHALAVEGITDDLIDDPDFVEFRTHCTTEGYTSDLILDGQSGAEALRAVCAAGYGSPRLAETIGVTIDRDRTGEDPVQVFTARNMAALSWSKPFGLLPDALRLRFADAALDGAPGEAIVWRAGREAVPDPLIETVDVDALTSAGAVAARGAFDLRQAAERAVTWSWRAGPDATRVRRGDLVELRTTILLADVAEGRVTALDRDGATVTSIALDAAVPVWSEPDMASITDMSRVADMSKIGMSSSVLIRRADGTMTTQPLANPTGTARRLVFAAPVTDAQAPDGDWLIRPECLATVGPAGAERLRVLVTAVRPQGAEFEIEAVPEAPGLWAA